MDATRATDAPAAAGTAEPGDEQETAWGAELVRRSAAADARGRRGATWGEVRARLIREVSR